MKKSVTHSIGLVAGSAIFLALTPFAFASETVEATTPSGKIVTVPEHAMLVAPGLFHLGTAYDEASGQMVEGYAHVIRADVAHQKPDGVGNGGGGNDGGKDGGKPDKGGNDGGDPSSPTASCYGFIGDGVKWKTNEDWVVDPTNTFGIADATIQHLLTHGLDKWEDAADGTLGDGVYVDIHGNGSIDYTALADTTSPDGKNEVHFGDTSQFGSSVIAVNIGWGIFGGPKGKREFVEWDQVYNQNLTWSAEATGVAGAFDFESISTHELGHAMGLADLYTSECSAMTMYGYGSTGDISARSLEDGDVNGVSSLY